jgi:hypothetical protein
MVTSAAAGGVGSECEPPPAGVDFIDRWLRGEDPDLAPHLLLVGRTGSGKTTAARAILSRALRSGFDLIVLDWDGEYADDLPLPVYEPPFSISAPAPLVADALAEVERSAEGGHGVAYFLKKAITGAASLERAAEKLRTQFDVTSYALRAAIEAAVTRLEMLMQYIEFTTSNEPAGLGEGVYLLSEIPSIWARASVQQFLSAFHVFANRRLLIAHERDPLLPPVPPSILVIEEGGMGARATYLYHLMREARKARTKLVIITQELLEEELRQSCELLLFDCDPAMRKKLNAAIPHSQLRVGECRWVRRDGTAKKLHFKLR